MDVRALRYFVETVQQASFTRAADRLCVTQSTISKMVSQLETEVGAPLLVREGRRITLTDVGQVVYARGQEALALMTALQAEVRDTADLRRGEVVVGLPPTVNLLFAPAVSAFSRRHPGLRLVLRELPGPEVARAVLAGELEVGATLLPLAEGSSALARRRLAQHPLYVVGAAEQPWAGRASVPLTALRGERLLLLPDEFALTRRLRQAFQRARLPVDVVAQSADGDFLMTLAADALGVAILPAPLVQRWHPAGAAVARLQARGLEWEVAQVWAEGRYLSHAARAWLAVCDEVLGVA